jgi:hypothetical protein
MIVSITTKEELETELKDEKNKDKLVIIDFYATLVNRPFLVKNKFLSL